MVCEIGISLSLNLYLRIFMSFKNYCVKKKHGTVFRVRFYFKIVLRCRKSIRGSCLKTLYLSFKIKTDYEYCSMIRVLQLQSLETHKHPQRGRRFRKRDTVQLHTSSYSFHHDSDMKIQVICCIIFFECQFINK